MSIRYLKYICVLVLGLIATSCGINSNLMFKESKSDTVYYDSIPNNSETEYLISIDDRIKFQLYSNEGEALLKSGGESAAAAQAIEYVVKRDGTIELPRVGKVAVKGLSVEACEDLLEQLYAAEFLNPFVQVQITNKRVVVFPGNGSDARVINLENNNTTLMEALAQAGGITERGRAKRVKIMRRGEDGKRSIFVLDLSTLDGLQYVDMIVQANDYIYVEPTPQITKEVIKEVAPIISVISSSMILITVISNLK